MNKDSKSIQEFTHFLSLLFLLFLGLKLAKYIEWSWWWVFSPLWIPCLIIGILFVGALLYAVVEQKNGKNK